MSVICLYGRGSSPFKHTYPLRWPLPPIDSPCCCSRLAYSLDYRLYVLSNRSWNTGAKERGTRERVVCLLEGRVEG